MARGKQPRRIFLLNFLNGNIIGFGLLLFLAGTVILYTGLTTNTQAKSPLPPFTLDGRPQKLLIPALSITTSVAIGGLVKDRWILDDKNAFYLPTSGKLGEGFNTVIYAHRLPNLFGRLDKIKLKDQIQVFDQSGKDYNFWVYEIEIVTPNEVSKLESTVKNNLTLFTCDGWFDRTRLVVRAKSNLLENLPLNP